MRVGIIQSCYVPWRGFFDFIADVDLFVFHDDIQYTKGDWRNRNRIKTAQGTRWLTVPVHYRTVVQKISDTVIDDQTRWPARHLHLLGEHYRAAPHVHDALDVLAGTLETVNKGMTISELNVALTRRICAYLGIDTPLMMSCELAPTGTGTERLLGMLNKLHATAYLSGPSADAYLDRSAFRAAGIQLEYKSYDYAPYPQLHGEFSGAVSVLDLIANCGPQSVACLRSLSGNSVIVAGADACHTPESRRESRQAEPATPCAPRVCS